MAAEPRPASITLVRHGESVANALNPRRLADVPPEWRGTPDYKIPLTERGRRQSRNAAHGLTAMHPEGFDYVYHSPYVRTRETAHELAGALAAPLRERLDGRVRPDLFLREQAFGDADLIAAPAALADRFEECYRRFEAHRAQAGKFFTRPDNGDSWADVCERTHTFLGKLFVEERAGTDVLIVSHAVTIATFLYHLERRSEDEVVEMYQRDRIRNCAAGRFVYRPGANPRWERVYWNRTFEA